MLHVTTVHWKLNIVSELQQKNNYTYCNCFSMAKKLLVLLTGLDFFKKISFLFV
jgi:hypothetical protein